MHCVPSIHFLSCLYGSQPESSAAPIAVVFLSCLYGSQRKCFLEPRFRMFLSCLYGSQRELRHYAAAVSFLSCLYGSQHIFSPKAAEPEFLSCLYGSQPDFSVRSLPFQFLSCLYGSQLQEKVKELRRHRGKTHLHLFYPKFQQGARKADKIGISHIVQNLWLKFRHRGTIGQAIGAQCSRLLYLTGCLLDEEGKGLCGR